MEGKLVLQAVGKKTSCVLGVVLASVIISFKSSTVARRSRCLCFDGEIMAQMDILPRVPVPASLSDITLGR